MSFWRWVHIDFSELSSSSNLYAYRITTFLIKIFYAGTGLWGAINVSKIAPLYKRELDFQHPIWFIELLPVESLRALGFLCAISVILFPLIAALYVERRTLRILTFVSNLFFYALVFSSKGRIDHIMHSFILAQFIFIFLPNDFNQKDSQDIRARTLRIFWAAQAICMLTYSCAGISKLIGLSYDLYDPNKTNLLDSDSMSLQIARMWGRSMRAPLSGWFLEHEFISYWCQLSVVFFELLAFPLVFFPGFHCFLGLSIICMHMSTYLVMGISFREASFVALILLFCSPFSVFGKTKALPPN